MGSKSKAKKKSKKRPQRTIDAGDFVRSRRTWQPDWERMDREIEQINRELTRKRRNSA
jgi:hypothetical protein